MKDTLDYHRALQKSILGNMDKENLMKAIPITRRFYHKITDIIDVHPGPGRGVMLTLKCGTYDVKVKRVYVSEEVFVNPKSFVEQFEKDQAALRKAEAEQKAAECENAKLIKKKLLERLNEDSSIELTQDLIKRLKKELDI